MPALLPRIIKAVKPPDNPLMNCLMIRESKAIQTALTVLFIKKKADFKHVLYIYISLACTDTTPHHPRPLFV